MGIHTNDMMVTPQKSVHNLVKDFLSGITWLIVSDHSFMLCYRPQLLPLHDS